MATGSYTISITIPVLGATDVNYVSRGIVKEMLEQAKIAVGDGVSTSGNLVRTYTQAIGPVTVGTWALTVGT
jgi:hypothetical protein